jgi:hypothetical protein
VRPSCRYTSEKEITNSRDHLVVPIWKSFIIPFGSMLFPLLTAEWLHLLYFSTEYHNSRQKIVILFCIYILLILEVRLVYIFFGKTEVENCLKCSLERMCSESLSSSIVMILYSVTIRILWVYCMY